MQQFFFILGRNPALSVAEIISVLNNQKIKYSLQNFSSEVIIIALDESPVVPALMKILGGTIKIGRIIDEVGLDESELEFNKVFSAENLTENYLSKRNGKLHIGTSLYNCGGKSQYVAQLANQLKELNVSIKENLKKAGLKIGFVKVKDSFLSSVSVVKNQLISKGVEIVLILTDGKILVGKTEAVQEFASFSFRDYGRPEKDKRSGIIPPKLARIMINLAEVNKEAAVLDPFCGSGTILQEAIILGYKNIKGSDVSAKAVADTKRNIAWLYRNFPQLNKPSYNIEIFQMDIRSISLHLARYSTDAVITEPYLGPPLYKKPDFYTINHTLSGLTKLYLDAFGQFFQLLKPGGKIVVIFPIFETEGRIYFLQILDQIKELGFIQREFLDGKIPNNPLFQLSSRSTILYGHRQQFVTREILSFQKI
ncbi:hypothetical protein FJY90_01550 [Candidatus Gottesmanbacteria bacterium]|nr:hypothetical protein [Candidatus Gottesmanbacteria bacterium]